MMYRPIEDDLSLDFLYNENGCSFPRECRKINFFLLKFPECFHMMSISLLSGLNFSYKSSDICAFIIIIGKSKQKL